MPSNRFIVAIYRYHAAARTPRLARPALRAAQTSPTRPQYTFTCFIPPCRSIPSRFACFRQHACIPLCISNTPVHALLPPPGHIRCSFANLPPAKFPIAVERLRAGLEHLAKYGMTDMPQPPTAN